MDQAWLSDIFIEAGIEQSLYGFQCPLRFAPFGLELQLSATGGGEHEQCHDIAGICLLSPFAYLDAGIKCLAASDELGGGAGM